MPSGKTNLVSNTVCATIGSFVIQEQLDKENQIDVNHLLLSPGTGAVLSWLHDILDPTVHPNHRAFFHSIVFEILLIFAGIEMVKKIKEKSAKRKGLDQKYISKEEIFLAILFIAIIIFVIQDSFIKKGVPLT